MSEKNNTNTLYVVVGAVIILAVIGGFVYANNMNKNNNMSGNNSSMMSENVIVGGAAMYANKDIVSNVSNASNLTTLVTAVKAADLVQTLQSAGPFTVFGPTNDAFAKLPSGTVEMLLKPENKSKLQDILKYHVVSGKYKVSDLTDGQMLKTVQGGSIKVTKMNGKTMINGASIETSDVMQSNGVAHVIDTVLMPTEMANPMVGGMAMYADKDLVSNISTASNLTTLVTAVKAADLVKTLQGEGPFTAFGPDNDAFAKLPAGTVENLVKPENKATLTKILTYHVVSGKYLTKDLTDGQMLKTVQGENLTVVKANGKIMLKDSKGGMSTITTGDVMQSNGVAHVIDTVLMPN